MADIDGTLAPPGTRLAPRQNLGVAERGLSLAAGSLIAVFAARRKGPGSVALGLVGSLLLARGVTGASPMTRMLGQRPDEAEIAKAAGWASAALVSRSVTINAPRALVWERFRDLAQWPSWAQNVENIEIDSEVGAPRLRFVTQDASGPITWDAVINESRDDELLTLGSVPGSGVAMTARFELRDAPGGRGTEIHAALAYEPPGGSVGRYAAKLTQREPGIQLRRDLKRFKSLLETGEIAVNAPQGTDPKA